MQGNMVNIFKRILQVLTSINSIDLRRGLCSYQNVPKSLLFQLGSSNRLLGADDIRRPIILETTVAKSRFSILYSNSRIVLSMLTYFFFLPLDLRFFFPAFHPSIFTSVVF